MKRKSNEAIKRKKERKQRPLHLMTYLTIAVILVFLLFIVVTCAIYVKSYEKSLYETTRMNAEQAVALVADALTMNMDGIQQDMESAAKNLNLYQKEANLKQYLNSIANVKSDVIAAMIYDTNGTLLCYGAESGEMKQNRKDDQSYRPAVFERSDVHVSEPHVQNLFYGYYPWVVTTGIKVYSEVYERDVYFAMDISVTNMLAYIDSVRIGTQGYCFVIDSEGRIIYHPQQQVIYSGVKEENLSHVATLTDGITEDAERIYAVDKVPSNRWRVVGVSYVDEMIDGKVKIIYRNAAGFALIGLFMISGIILLISNKVSKPVYELSRAMRKFERNAEQFEYIPTGIGVYELESLSHSFEHMVKKIQQLMVQLVDEEKTVRKTELKALQAQINPHFLYNTLDSIQWMCERGENKKAIAMVGALARLFRISISKGKEIIPIEKELDHVKSYLIIQSYRFKGQFEYRFEVEEALLSYYCNKITLQPIVENAIIHGLEGMYDEGEVVIRVKDGGDCILMQVEDNGIGMTEEQCHKIIVHDESEQFGIGIKNVNDRLKIYFGKEFGLEIESELDEGTLVTVRIPKLSEDEVQKEGGIR